MILRRTVGLAQADPGPVALPPWMTAIPEGAKYFQEVVITPVGQVIVPPVSVREDMMYAAHCGRYHPLDMDCPSGLYNPTLIPININLYTKKGILNKWNDIEIEERQRLIQEMDIADDITGLFVYVETCFCCPE